MASAPLANQRIRQLLAMPAGTVMSVERLKLDPVWDPLRGEPRFQALLKKYAPAQPVPGAGGVAVTAFGARNAKARKYPIPANQASCTTNRGGRPKAAPRLGFWLTRLVPEEGIEPPTHALRMRCSTS